jgi:hypothetical protein
VADFFDPSALGGAANPLAGLQAMIAQLHQQPAPVAPPLLATPKNYKTPETMKASRAYANALLENSQKPIQHWTQGVSNMVSALVGGNLNYRTNQEQNEANAVRAGRLAPEEVPVKPSFSEGPTSEGGTKSGDPLLKSASAISGLESGGDYESVGRVTKTGDRAYGKYQVMGANVPEWTEATLGKSMTPEEFLKNPEAQEAVFKNKFGEYTQKYGPQGAAKAWFAGERGMNNPNATDANGMTVDRYGKGFARAFGQESAGSSPAVTAISSALRGEPAGGGDPQVAAVGVPKPLTNPHVAPDGTGIFFDPALIKPPPRYNAGQIRGMLSDPTISETQQNLILQQYNTQDQSIMMKYPGGMVLIDPRNPTKQQYIPDLHWGKNEIGDVKTDSASTIDSKGNLRQAPILPPAVGPRSEVVPAPTAAPAVAPQGGPGGAVPASPVVAQNASAAPAGAPSPVQVASLDPTAGVAKAAGVDGVIPVAVPAAAAAAAATPLSKWAQATPPTPNWPPLRTSDPDPVLEKLRLHNFPQSLIDDYVAKKGFEDARTLALKKGESDIGVSAKAIEENNKLALDRYKSYVDTIAPATAQRENLSMAKIAANDPRFYGGVGNDLVEGWKKIKDALGIEPGAAAPMEIFRKTTAQSIMSGLKTAFGGLGQIRVAEIQLQQTANASTANTVPAVRALLEITDRNAKKLQDVGGMATAYKAGEAVMDPNNPDKVLVPANKLGPDGLPMERTGITPAFERVIDKWRRDNPTFSEAEEKQLMLDLKKKPGDVELPSETATKPVLSPVAPGQTVGQEQEFTTKNGGKVIGVWDGTKWGPKK